MVTMVIKSFYILKSFGAFWITLYYLIVSCFRPSQITVLKKQWAQSLMNYLGYEVSATGSFAEKGPHIYVGNHVSYLDILLLMATNPHIAFLGKIEVKSWPIIGQAAVRVGTLFIDRESKSDREKLRRQIGEQLMQKNAQLVIFPSGTTTLQEEKMWKKGIFEIAQSYNIPVQLFKIDYHPYNESSYIGEDNLIDKMATQFRIPNKKANVAWLESIHITHPENDAENLRLKVRKEFCDRITN